MANCQPAAAGRTAERRLLRGGVHAHRLKFLVIPEGADCTEPPERAHVIVVIRPGFSVPVNRYSFHDDSSDKNEIKKADAEHPLL